MKRLLNKPPCVSCLRKREAMLAAARAGDIKEASKLARAGLRDMLAGNKKDDQK